MLETGASETVRQLVPDYELLKSVGRGAFGEVWLARSKATGILRAAKIVWRRNFEDDRPFQREFEGVQRFERISRGHPSQLALFHIGRNDTEGYFYYVMELADAAGNPKPDVRNSKEGRGAKSEGFPADEAVGVSAFDLRASDLYTPHTLRADLGQGRLPGVRVLEIGLALAEALGHLHNHGLVHRDVKPSNVIFVNGRPKLADIGLVTDASDQCSIVGTEGYLPPEGPGTPQADIFALGKVLYEGLTGQDRRQFPNLPPDLKEWPKSEAKLALELNEIVVKACAERSGQRYRTTNAIREELALLGNGRSVRQKRARRQRWALAQRVLLAAVILSAIIIGGHVWWRRAHRALRMSSNGEARERYLQARYEIQSESLDQLLRAYTNLTQAVERDPKFTAAYFRMLELYWTSFGNIMPPYTNQLRNLRMVAERLKKTAPSSAEYHVVNSWVCFMERKSEQAIQEAALAKRIDPGFVRAHGLYAFYVLLVRGDTATARSEIKIAEDLEPDDVVIQHVKGYPLYAEGEYELAIRQFDKALQLEPRGTLPHQFLGRAYEACKQYANALREYEAFDLGRGTQTDAIRSRYQKLNAELRDKGPIAMWETAYDEAITNGSRNQYELARICVRLGKNEEAIRLLIQAYEKYEWMGWLREDDCWQPLHSDPDYQDLLKKMGFSPFL